MESSMTQLKRACGYVRTSTDEQYLSVEDQRARILAWVDLHADEYEPLRDDDILVDVGVSGGVPLRDRPAGKRLAPVLLEPRRPGRPRKNGRDSLLDVDTVIVTRLDRLSRDVNDGYLMAAKLSASPKGALVSISDHIDCTTAYGRFAFRLRFEIAAFERELIGERTSDVLARKRANGTVHTSERYGWDRVGDHSACAPGHCACRWERNDDEQRTLVDMRGWRGEGLSDYAVAARLNETGVPTKRGGASRWYPQTVKRLLAAPATEELRD